VPEPERVPEGLSELVRPRSLTWATELDALPVEARVQRRPGYLLVRSPNNPTHWWGNLLLFDEPPRAGDLERWEGLFEREFADEPVVTHRTFAWDSVDGELGEGAHEFTARGYDLEKLVGLIAAPKEIRAHPRENRDVLVRRLDPREGADAQLWRQALEIQVAGRDERIPEDEHREFALRRQGEWRSLFRARPGGWYVALDARTGEVLASCALMVLGERASIHDVDTIASHRRRGICSRLLVEAVNEISRARPPAHVVIAADPDYHALGIYESLGFKALERCAGVSRMPPRAGSAPAS
jgi:ribosomal protein S18 acetylase RimI-like enzyme